MNTLLHPLGLVTLEMRALGGILSSHPIPAVVLNLGGTFDLAEEL